mgnify:CR=1 FL=1
MHEQHVAQIAAELGLRAEQVVATIELIDAGESDGEFFFIRN